MARHAISFVLLGSVPLVALSLLVSPRLNDEAAVTDGVAIVSPAWPFVVICAVGFIMTVLLIASAVASGNEVEDLGSRDGKSALKGSLRRQVAISDDVSIYSPSRISKPSCRWQQYKGPSDTQHSGRILCVGSFKPSERMAGLSRRLVWTHSSVDLIDDFETALEVISSTPEKWKLLIVDVDYAEKNLDIEDIVRDLISFREECRSCAIALLSAGFATDDGSLIRSFIADYSFRATISNERLIETFPAVFENHNEFLKRKTSAEEANNVFPFGRMEGV